MSKADITASITQSAMLPGTSERPSWLDAQLYPFQSRFVEIDGNLLHYIDEGTGPLLFFLHPGIGWSLIYHDIIKDLRSRFRCVAMDLPGFGLSSATAGYRHTLTADSLLLERFLQVLGLEEITLFAHDVTGAIGLGVVGRRPEWFRAVIIGPSFIWPLEEYRRIYYPVKLLGTPVIRLLSVRFNLLMRYSLKALTKKPKQPFSPQEKRAYLGPLADHRVRGYTSDLFKSAVESHDYLVDLQQCLSVLHELPALLIFGETDGLVKLGWLSRLEQLLPRHRSLVLPGCHHFPQVYDPMSVAAAIRTWWDEDIQPLGSEGHPMESFETY